MATQPFTFDFSQFQPLMDRSLQAIDYRLGRMPREAGMADRAFAEHLTDRASRRGIAEGEYDMRRKGSDALTALQRRGTRRSGFEEGGPAGQMRQFQTLRNLSSIGPRYSYSQGMADQAARAMTWGGARPITYGSDPYVGERR